MKKFYVITNKDKDKDLLLTTQVRRYLEERGASCMVHLTDQKHEGEFRYTNPASVPGDTECVIVLGGDGTLLQAARDLVKEDLPLLGINIGNLGFLAEVDRHSLYPSLDKLLEDHYEIEERMMLYGEVFRGRQILGSGIALNDIVISRDGPLRVVSFRNYVNNEFLNAYNADGIIVSTPTGSTGYSLSAGGPVVSPGASMSILTAIAPHTMNARSIILPAEDVITVEIGEGRHNDIEQGIASFDGDISIPMITGDRIVIRKSTNTTKILKLNRLSFVEVLRQKMLG